MQVSKHSVVARDRHEIPIRLWAADAATPRGLVQICHGLGEHSARYTRLAGELVAAGFAVAAHDHRGHGEAATDGLFGHFADEDGWSLIVDDVLRVNQWFRSRHENIPLCLLGHSMGSYIAQSFAIRHDEAIQSLILSGSTWQARLPLHIGRIVARIEKVRIGGRGKSALLDKMSFGTFNKKFSPPRTAFDWLSRDNAEVDTYIDDPLCGQASTTQLWIDLIGGLLEIGSVRSLAKIRPDLPTLIVGGSDDPVSAGNRLAKLSAALRAASLSNITLHVYDGARHEIFNETNRNDVTADLLRWLDAR